MADIEIWKDIDDFEGLYQVSNLGRIRSLDRYADIFRHGKFYKKLQPGRILSIQKDSHGYNQIQLHYGTRNMVHTFRVCTIVAKHFIPNPENKPCVDHINTIRDDDRACNLRWVTYKENAHNPLTMKKYLGRKNPQLGKRKPVVQYAKNGEFIKQWDYAGTAAEQLGISKSNIQSVCQHRPHFHTAGGFRWEYA